MLKIKKGTKLEEYGFILFGDIPKREIPSNISNYSGYDDKDYVLFIKNEEWSVNDTQEQKDALLDVGIKPYLEDSFGNPAGEIHARFVDGEDYSVFITTCFEQSFTHTSDIEELLDAIVKLSYDGKMYMEV